MQLLHQIVDQVKQHPKLVAVDDYEVCVSLRAQKKKQYSNGEIDSSSEGQSLWISLRLSHRKQPGRSFTTSASKDAISKLVESAYVSAERSEVDPWFRFPLWRQFQTQADIVKSGFPEDGFDSPLYPELTEVPALLFENYESKEECFGIARKREKQTLLRRSFVQEVKYALGKEGVDAPVRITTERAKASAVKEKRKWLAEDLGMLVAHAEARTFHGRIEGPVILGPRVMAAFLKQMKDWFLADRYQKKLSPIKEISDRFSFFSPCLTLVDDGNLIEGAYAADFDMEGVACQATKIVEKGSFRSFLYDTYCATRENRLSTGNFFANKEQGFPELAPSMLFFQKGTNSNILTQLENGYCLDLIDSVAKTESSKVAATLRGWKVEKGALQYPVAGIRVEVDLLDLLRHAASVGEDLQFFGHYGSPSILFEKMP